MQPLAALAVLAATTNANAVNGVGLVLITIAVIVVLAGAIVFFVRRRR